LIEGYGLIEFGELDSTNEEARRRAQAGEPGPLWILAARQTSGRGRRGRAWHSEAGNLFATLLIRPKRIQPEWPQLSFAAAIAVADMTAGFTPDIAVKWPNDVLAASSDNNWRKLAGILLETAGDSLVIGIGVNLVSHPEGTEFPAICLSALGAEPPSPKEALDLLAQNFAEWYDRWESAGFAPIRDAWLARAAGLGSPIRARLPGKDHVGMFEGIDDQGALLLREENQIRAIAAGEVFFG
jgi:BirA family biotin operon repressor/biotin-[acetyl-CoA-carboxylase] ligase